KAPAAKKTEKKEEEEKPKEVAKAEPLVTPAKAEPAKPTKPETQEPEEDVKEHIEMKAPKLEGPKIIGRIELPVKDDTGRGEREKRRKRIPVQKKPERVKDVQGRGRPGDAKPGE